MNIVEGGTVWANFKQKQDLNDNNKNRGWNGIEEDTWIKSELGKQNIQHSIIFHMHNEMNAGNGYDLQLQRLSENKIKKKLCVATGNDGLRRLLILK